HTSARPTTVAIARSATTATRTSTTYDPLRDSIHLTGSMLPTAVDGPCFAGGTRLHNGVPVLKRASVAPLAALLLLAAASADAGWQRGDSAGASARAQAIRIDVPGETGGATPAVSAPTDQVLFSGGFSYGEDPNTHAPIVSTGSATASASTATDVEANASAGADVN